MTQRALLETGRARSFPEMRRVQQSWVACAEKRALLWLAARTPSWIGSDHMTMLGLVSQIGAGACYALAPWNRYALLGVIACLALNWLGDSLDGTLDQLHRFSRGDVQVFDDFLEQGHGVGVAGLRGFPAIVIRHQ